MSSAARASKKPSGTGKSHALPFVELMRRKSWRPLPAVAIIFGDAQFFHRAVERRFIREIFGDESSRTLLRVDGSGPIEGMLARVLDELRTLSILSAARLVIMDSADPFLAAHRDDLEPFVRSGFAGGHLLLHTERSPDARRRFTAAVREKGWLVECRQPFDRPPPWKSGTDPWKNDLSAWIVEWAASKELEISLRDAFLLQERVGTDLGFLDKSLDMIRTYLGADRSRVSAGVIEAVTSDIREDSIFDLVESFIASDRARALDIAERLLRSGYHPARGNPIHAASSIAMLFTGALVSRVRPLRRAHALQAAGEGPDRWLELKLTSRPFIDRFRREMAAMPPRRIQRVFETLLEMDRRLKSGGNARTELILFLSRG